MYQLDEKLTVSFLLTNIDLQGSVVTLPHEINQISRQAAHWQNSRLLIYIDSYSRI